MKGLILISTLFVYGALALPLRSQTAGESGEVSGATSQSNSFLGGQPLTFADLAKAVGVVYEGRLKTAIEHRGVAPPLTGSEIAQLRSAGASADLLQAIRRWTRAKEPTGKLSLQCLPAECQVLVNGQEAGRTTKGLLEVKDLKPGQAAVTFLKSGYDSQALAVSIQPDTEQVKAVRLEPDLATQKQAGQDLLHAMLTRLGQVDVAPALYGSGTATLWADGKRTDWRLVAEIETSSQAISLEIQGSGLNWRTSLKAGVMKSEGSKKLKGSAVALEMERLARVFYNGQPSTIAARFRGSDVTKLVCDLSMDEQGDRVLQVQAGTDSYAALIAPNGTPLGVHNAGVEITYADFTDIHGYLYPTVFAIRNLGASAPPATLLHFEHVIAVPKLSEGRTGQERLRHQR